MGSLQFPFDSHLNLLFSPSPAFSRVFLAIAKFDGSFIDCHFGLLCKIQSNGGGTLTSLAAKIVKLETETTPLL